MNVSYPEQTVNKAENLGTNPIVLFRSFFDKASTLPEHVELRESPRTKTDLLANPESRDWLYIVPRKANTDLLSVRQAA